ncbi:hypothetical protein EV361DRAFT_953687 [Lentinula raphanica]|uniref:Uncharacterized protein n=1 Tax=Lentinula raphanica TaxID=153919 RepID=A0AA38P1Q5_9AGAR|nr:hypothetical protein F5878DRAFT_664529 [Lentinula raphanica]KAJ3966904.1 hypothetical protein EV361DRAFT_953687 [Lentinula raphanica]
MFKKVAVEAEKVLSLFWAVNLLGKGVGVYFDSLEALQSIDEATTHLKHSLAFGTFAEAVQFQMGNEWNPAIKVYGYDPSQLGLAEESLTPPPSERSPTPPPSESDLVADTESDLESSASSTPTAPILQTPRRAQTASIAAPQSPPSGKSLPSLGSPEIPPKS